MLMLRTWLIEHRLKSSANSSLFAKVNSALDVQGWVARHDDLLGQVFEFFKLWHEDVWMDQVEKGQIRLAQFDSLRAGLNQGMDELD